MLKRDIFTARGHLGFSPLNNPGAVKSLVLINMGQSAIGLMDVINLGVLSNFSNAEFYFGPNCDQRYHYEKQPQFLDEVASRSFFSVNAGLNRLKSPIFDLPPHQTATGEFILILDYLGTYKYKI